MSKVWKWVLGIVIVLVVVAALVAVPFVIHNYTLANSAANGLQQGQGFYGGPMMRGFDGFRHPMMRGGQGFFDDRRMPMFGGGLRFNRAFGFGFLFLGFFFRLIPLVILALVIFGVYQWGKRSGLRSSQMTAPAATPPAAPAESEHQDPGTPAA